jgi:predicted RNase H-like HicB family nuclease
MPRDLEYYMALEYPFEMRRTGDDFEAEFKDLRGCVSFGGTPDEAYSNLLVAKREWLDMALELGMDIPEPSPEQEIRHSGRILVRCARPMHGQLLELAGRQGISLNQLICSALAGFVARGGSYRAQPEPTLAASWSFDFAGSSAGLYQPMHHRSILQPRTTEHFEFAEAG